MTSPLAFRLSHLRTLKAPVSSCQLKSLRCLSVATFTREAVTSEGELRDPNKTENTCQKKLLKVAIVGRPNAGKSTLINGLLRLNLFGVSYKSHTTVTNARAAYTKGDTQIVFMDTPGLVTLKERSRFHLPNNFLGLRNNKLISNADIIGVVHEIQTAKDIHKFHLCLTQNLHDIPSSIPTFLVINKIDLVLDQEAFAKAVESVMLPEGSDKKSIAPKVWKKFSKIFFTSAIKNIGLNKISEYLIQQAKPGEWIFESGQITDKPLNLIILELIRSHFLDILPHEVPYRCKYEIEYLKINSIGEIICVALITCKYPKHKLLILTNQRKNLKEVSKSVENDIYKITGRVCKLRIVVS